MRKRQHLPFSVIRPSRTQPERWARNARTQLALRMLKRVKVKGGCDWRLNVAPMFARQRERLLST